MSLPGNKPSMLNMAREGRAVFELGLSTLLMPALLRAPKGDGHPVMVLPGFLASDFSTRPLRTYLKMKGYKAVGWGLGRNLGTHIVGGKHVVSDTLINQVIKLSLKYDSKISLVGWSLGGILAREIARVAPDCVRQVITLGSPFNGVRGEAPVAAKIFELINGDIQSREPETVAKTFNPPPVPSTAIFSRSDGVAHWKACANDPHHLSHQTENIEVNGSHIGLGHNAQVLWVIANRLAQQEGQWRPFSRKGLNQALFANPHRA
jgi:pimeloyl-ACP methyl ester carboxylesterase